MKYTNLGNTGVSVSRICLGMMTYGSKSWRDWVLEYDEALPILSRAWEAGINFYDTADVYSNGASEEVLGRMVRDLGIDREDIVIATKCFNGTHDRKRNRWGLSRKHVMAACDASLERLGTDYIDLYQIHRFDPRTPVEETIDALSDLVRAGKVRYIGASSMYAWQMSKYLHLADSRGAVRFVSMQNHYNLLYREEEREMIPLCRDEQIALIPWSPLARGYLTRTRETLKDTVRANSDEFASMLYRNPADLDIRNLNITPLDDFKTMGITNHKTDLNIWRLGIEGWVERPFYLTYSQILALPAFERNVLLICPGFFANNGRWKGISLIPLLEKAKIKEGTTMVSFSGPEGIYERTQSFHLKDVLSNKVFLAYGVNGKPLPMKHGFPLRVVAQGHYGFNWIKYVHKVSVR